MLSKTAPDWFSQDFLADPYPHYRALRESEPIHFDETRRTWIITSYQEAEEDLRDGKHFSAEQGLATSMLVTDPPEHTRLRTLESQAFTPRMVLDLLSAMIRAEERGDFLTHGELLAMLLLLLVGGHETTVNLIGNGLLALLRNPGQAEILSSEDGSEKRAVEELLRYDSPVQYSGR